MARSCKPAFQRRTSRGSLCGLGCRWRMANAPRGCSSLWRGGLQNVLGECGRPSQTEGIEQSGVKSTSPVYFTRTSRFTSPQRRSEVIEKKRYDETNGNQETRGPNLG